jgi:16S rRNA (guanine527-N7)-methyltransferase
MNLTAITDDADFARLHLLDSAALLSVADFRGKRVVDVGTGAGFPGVPLRILCPDVRMTLLDSTGKRIDFLREACAALGLTGVDCVHARAEEFAAEHRESFDLAVSRAVAALPVLCELCLPLVKVGGQFLAMKSARSDEELEGAMDAITTLGGRLADVVDYAIPGSDVTHRVIVIDKTDKTPKQYPRQYGQIKKKPL